MDTDQHIYRSYLLRLWRSKSDSETSWYASLEDPVTGECKGFSTLNAMVDFLETNREDLKESMSHTPEK